uniref:Translocon-associated protein subunit alpha n=1 Tax=Rattus norvegicus TaxID=10116 RepID=A0A0G2K075_RAT
MRLLPRLLLLFLLAFPAAVLLRGGPGGSLAVAQDLTEDEETVEDPIIEDEDDEAEVEEDEPTDLAEEKEEEEDVSSEPEASPSADTTILFVKGEDFPANNIVKFLVGFTNKGTEDFIVESLDASFRYPQDYQFYIQNFTALPLNTIVPPQRQATFEYSFIPAEPMGGRPFGLVINLNYKDLNGNVFQDAVFNQTVTVIEREDGLDGETIFMYMFLAGLGLLVVVGLHQLLESRKRKRPIQKVEMGTSSQNDVDMSWIPQETLNQIMQSRRGEIKLLREGCPGSGHRRDRWDLMSAGRERHTEVTLQLHRPVVSDASYACFSCFRKLPRPATLAAWTSSLRQLAVCGI